MKKKNEKWQLTKANFFKRTSLDKQSLGISKKLNSFYYVFPFGTFAITCQFKLKISFQNSYLDHFPCAKMAALGLKQGSKKAKT